MRVLLLGIVALVVGCGHNAGTAEIPDGSFTIVDKGGLAAIHFGNRFLIFEAVPAKTVPVGAGGTINISPGQGHQVASFGAFQISQTWNANGNAVTVNGIAFKVTFDGSLAFRDRTYPASPSPLNILILKTGATRLEPDR